MKLLLDSHILLWYIDGDSRLGSKKRDLIESENSQIFISSAAFWELSIKESLGKFSFVGGVVGIHEKWIKSGVAIWLPVEWPHLNRLIRLPQIHRDPFDRIMIAQAQEEQLSLVTHERRFQEYPELQVIL
jgi:PIN domain nuclease of toxin-antitoxin system